jgi:hypothetical protein
MVHVTVAREVIGIVSSASSRTAFRRFSTAYHFESGKRSFDVMIIISIRKHTRVVVGKNGNKLIIWGRIQSIRHHMSTSPLSQETGISAWASRAKKSECFGHCIVHRSCHTDALFSVENSSYIGACKANPRV